MDSIPSVFIFSPTRQTRRETVQICPTKVWQPYPRGIMLRMSLRDALHLTYSDACHSVLSFNGRFFGAYKNIKCSLVRHQHWGRFILLTTVLMDGKNALLKSWILKMNSEIKEKAVWPTYISLKRLRKKKEIEVLFYFVVWKITILSLTSASVVKKIWMFIKLSKAKRPVTKIGHFVFKLFLKSLNTLQIPLFLRQSYATNRRSEHKTISFNHFSGTVEQSAITKLGRLHITWRSDVITARAANVSPTSVTGRVTTDKRDKLQIVWCHSSLLTSEGTLKILSLYTCFCVTSSCWETGYLD